jgi:hypothetical protein
MEIDLESDEGGLCFLSGIGITLATMENLFLAKPA